MSLFLSLSPSLQLKAENVLSLSENLSNIILSHVSLSLSSCFSYGIETQTFWPWISEFHSMHQNVLMEGSVFIHSWPTVTQMNVSIIATYSISTLPMKDVPSRLPLAWIISCWCYNCRSAQLLLSLEKAMHCRGVLPQGCRAYEHTGEVEVKMMWSVCRGRCACACMNVCQRSRQRWRKSSHPFLLSK